MELIIEDMTCGGCAASISRVVEGLDPNAKLKIDVAGKRVAIDSMLAPDIFLTAISGAGFTPVIAP